MHKLRHKMQSEAQISKCVKWTAATTAISMQVSSQTKQAFTWNGRGRGR